MPDPRLFSLLTLLIFLLTGCGGPRPAGGEDSRSFGRLLRDAEAKESAGDFLAAARDYEAAFRLKPQRTELANQAAELFSRQRAYGRAADLLAQLPPNERRWPLRGLRYGRALKQDGRYAEAREVLVDFRTRYNAADRPIVTDIITNELAGIDLALRAKPDGSVTLDRPGRGVNTGADEFGPVPVTGDELYFTSTQGGQSRLYRSRLEAGVWSKATVPPGFPVITEGGFGTGSFSADGRAFFFTICSGATGGEATNRCEIFRGERSVGGSWGQPRPLGSAINAEGTNNAFPAVFTGADGITRLYFASDRPGGRGGLDLYLSVLRDPADPLSFGPPVNLGTTVNSLGDEISPFLDAENGLFYFASNGHPGYGGLDVFRSPASGANDFGPPENLGAPVNSAAEDYGLSLSAGGERGYLASNRNYDDKTTTLEEDIFTLDFTSGRARLKATVYDQATGGELPGATVVLYAEDEAGTARELDRRTFSTGKYDFELTAGGRYLVDVNREGYRSARYRVDTRRGGSVLYGQPVFLVRATGGGEAPPPPAPPADGSSPRRPDADPRGSSAPDPGAPRTVPAPAPAPPGPELPADDDAPSGISYRIQIAATAALREGDAVYDGVRSLGDLRSETIPGRSGIVRVTVGKFSTLAEVRRVIDRVRASGFPSAFPVRYENGARRERVRL